VNVILVEPAEVDDRGDVTLADARATHLSRVLQVTAGQDVRIGLIDGALGTGTVTNVAHDRVTLRCAFDVETPPIPPVDVLLALPRPKVLRRLWAQLAALGVGRIILTNAERVERHYFDTHILASDTYRPLLIEGLQQARDTRLPQVSIHRQFKILIEDHLDAMSDAATRIVADPRAQMRIDEPLSARRGGRVLLAVGPEGGWNDFELELLARHGFQSVGMGSRTLRTDTACVALLTLVHQMLER
jgi:RsmE family RNA methyltransferase